MLPGLVLWQHFISMPTINVGDLRRIPTKPLNLRNPQFAIQEGPHALSARGFGMVRRTPDGPA